MSSTRVRFRRKAANHIPCLTGLLLISSLSLAFAGCSGIVSGNSTSGGSPTPLSITNVQPSAPTSTGFQVSWSTNLAANSEIDYGTSASYGASTPVNNTMVTSHQMAVTGLATGTLYHFRVRSTDASNNLAVSSDMTFATAGDTTAPTVSITSPAANATLSGTANVTVTASDNIGVTSVQLKIDNANSGAAVTAAPYVIAVNTVSLSNGNHILTAVASDAAGNSATSAQVAVKVNNTNPDTTPPTVSMSAPANGATVSGTVSITANASDNVGVASVQFQLDGANFGSLDTASPYSVSWNTTTSSNGSHTLRAIAKDAAGNSATSTAVTVTVSNSTTDTTPPTVSISAPANGATVSGTVSVTANASDNVGVASVQFQLDGANVGALDTTAPYSFSWNTTTATNASHTVRAIAKDAAGNSTTSAGVTVTVNNGAADTTPPSVPTGLTATAASSSQINLSWTASTDNVGVTGYKVFRGGSQIATSTTTSFSDTGLSASTSFSYTVAASDAAGNTSAQSSSATATTQGSGGGGGSGQIPSTLGWFSIPNTNFARVQQTSWPAAGDPSMVFVAWGGATFDTKRNRLTVFGGGHGDYKGNEVYVLDLQANPITPVRLTEPDQYPIGQTCLGTVPGHAPDPVSRHMYGGLTYLPTQDAMFVMGGSAADSGCGQNDGYYFNLASNTWTQRSPGWNAWQNAVPNCDYNGAAGTVLCFNNTVGSMFVYNPSQNTMTEQSQEAGGFPDLSFTGVMDPDGKRFYLVGGGDFEYYDVSGAPPYPARQTVTASNCGTFNAADYPGVAYDPVQKILVQWAGGNTVNTYNPATNSCSSVTNPNGPASAGAHGTNGRFRYVPSMGIFILCNDWANNCYSLRLTAPTGGTGGSGGPAISGVGASLITTVGATISWTTDVAATTQVEYGTTTAYGTITTLNANLVTAHVAALTGLSAGTLYHYRVHSKNSGGTESISGDFAFSTNNTTDTTAPTVSITSPAGGATVNGTLSVTANASDNVGVASVQFLLDGANLGAMLTTAPYSVTWDTTTAGNGSHMLSAQAKDAAGNTGTSTSVSVTVSNSSGGGTATQNFQSRCAQAGVLTCQGFDDPTIFNTVVSEAGLTDGFGSASHPNLTRDTSVFVSGGSSANFFIPAGAGENDTGNFWAFFGQGVKNQIFGQNSTFYVQYAFRADSSWTSTDWTQFGGSGSNTSPKLSIFHNVIAGSCAEEEITVHNHNGKDLPTIYTECGGRQAITDSDGSIYNENGSLLYFQQGWTVAAPFTGYQCEYTGGSFSGPNCFHFAPNQWYTLYFKVHIGTWGSANSSIEAWVAPYGQQMVKWINTHNYIMQTESLCDATGTQQGNLPCPGYNTIELTQFMTAKIAGTGPAAHVWYDELIISSQPIPAPAGVNP